MISVRPFGKTPFGDEAQLFIIENGTSVLYITDYGARIVALSVKDKEGILTDVVTGYDNAADYIKQDSFGATVGRFANRIAKGKFTLNGVEYSLAINNGPNHLHGGIKGFSKQMFETFVSGNSLTMKYKSPDMDEGYPGNLEFTVKYTLTDDNTLRIEYEAKSDEDTVINFTNHSYFNLNGVLKETKINDLIMSVSADGFCETDSDLLANGHIIDVTGTPLDFRTPKRIGEALDSKYEAIKTAKGIDHNFVLDNKFGAFKKAADLYSRDTGIFMECYTDQPGIQIYTGNFLDDECIGKCSITFAKQSAVCFETQGFPNSPNISAFPSPVLKKGEIFSSVTEYRFSVK